MLKNVFPTPGLVPHECFHKGIWLLPKNNGIWYYFVPIPKEKIATKAEYDLDKYVKPIVQFLHEKNIDTTPSCSGHFYKESNFSFIYDSLLKEAESLKGDGLIMENKETGENYRFKKHNYKLPWTRAEFIKRAKEYQKKGVIGIKDESRQEQLLEINIPGVHIKIDDDITIFIVKSHNDFERKNIWMRLEKEIKQVYN